MANGAILSRTSQGKPDVLFIENYLMQLDCARALSVWILFNQDPAELTRLQFDPRHYETFDVFRRSYQAHCFLSKYEGLQTGIDTRAVATVSFVESEARCRDTNLRLGRSVTKGDTLAWFLLQGAKRKIADLLPPLSEVIEEVISLASFGPGVTASLSGRWLGAPSKVRSKQSVTSSLHSCLSHSLKDFDYPQWNTLRMRCIMDWNKVAFVPKNSKTDRSIAIEPSVNAFYQRGVGRWLQRRLRRWNIRLDDQKSNADLAKVGSVTNDLATVDLSSASDSISLELVRYILPPDWLRLLEVLRAPNYLLNNEIKRYEKFSSMGNGFTFELETMIFHSFLLSIREAFGEKTDVIRTYGDDIVCPSSYEVPLTEVLRYSGFVLNSSKSFFSGYFRESCGEHYWNGQQCTPFYLRKKNDVVQKITFHNWLYVNNSSYQTRMIVQKTIPREWRNYGPVGGPGQHLYGDGLDTRLHFGVNCYAYTTVIFRPSKRSCDGPHAVAAALLQAPDRVCELVPLENDRSSEFARRHGSWVRKRLVFYPTLSKVNRLPIYF